IPHGIRTPWWRLLLDRLSNQAHLHRIMATKHPTDICPLCATEAETLPHFAVDCPLKTTFWIYALPIIHAPHQNSITDIWHALNPRFSSTDAFCAQNLLAIGLAFQTVWSMHWRCVMEGSTWNLTV
ncbi:hypothetical protein BJV82DRAFT_485943, partial [Fennellomyces sp. T-0311]